MSSVHDWRKLRADGKCPIRNLTWNQRELILKMGTGAKVQTSRAETRPALICNVRKTVRPVHSSTWDALRSRSMVVRDPAKEDHVWVLNQRGMAAFERIREVMTKGG